MNHDAMETLANKFFAAVEKGDLDTIVSMYDPEIRIWHSRDEANTDITQSRELLGLFFSRVIDRRYEVISRHFHDGGFTQEHVVHGVMPDGSKMRLPVCFVCTLNESGRIKRIAEYYDSGRSPLKGVVQHEA